MGWKTPVWDHAHSPVRTCLHFKEAKPYLQLVGGLLHRAVVQISCWGFATFFASVVDHSDEPQAIFKPGRRKQLPLEEAKDDRSPKPCHQ